MKIKTLLLLTLLSVLGFAAAAQTNAPPALPPSDINGVLQLLTGKFGWLSGVLIWIGALKVVLHFAGPQIQSWAAAKLAWNVDNYSSDHDLFIRSVLTNKLYRLLSGALGLLSVDLPNIDAYEKQLAAQKTAPPLVPAPPADPPTKSAPIPSIVLALLLPLALMSGGCVKTLDQGGVYGSGAAMAGTNATVNAAGTTNAPTADQVAASKVLYLADNSIALGYDTIHDFVQWEYTYRANLAKWPEIRVAADVMRGGAPNWLRTAVRLRDAYRDNPSEANRTALQRSTAVLDAAIVEAIGYLKTHATAGQPQPLPPLPPNP